MATKHNFSRPKCKHCGASSIYARSKTKDFICKLCGKTFKDGRRK